MTAIDIPLATDPVEPVLVDPHELVWTMPEAGVWAASEPGPHRRIAAGFVHLVGGRYLAVDGLGAGIGAFDDLVVAQSAVSLAVGTSLASSVWMREL